MERKPIRFELRLSPELADEIDWLRRQLPDLPARAEAARKLIEVGLRHAYERLLEKAFRALEDARKLNEPADKMRIYEVRVQECRDAIARISNPSEKKASPSVEIIGWDRA
jgi:hypothetical protein